MHALEARDVSLHRCGRSLVQRVSLYASRGDMLALCGEEGSGTRTLLHLLGGGLVPDAGAVLVDGVDRAAVRWPVRRPDARRVAYGPLEAAALVDDPGDGSILLFEDPVKGLGSHEAHVMLAALRRRADEGAAVVVSVETPHLAARHASAVALLVAGRLLSFGAPAVALVPAMQILSAGGFALAAAPAFDQAGSIITSST